MDIRPNMIRYAVNDTIHYNSQLWNQQTLSYIQNQVSDQLYSKLQKRITVTEDRIKEVMDSVSQSNPHTGTNEIVHMIIQFIVHYIVNEYTTNHTPEYDSSVLLYDGSYGIQRISPGQIGIKKKGLNTIGYCRF